MRIPASILPAFLIATSLALAVDLENLWNFGDPEASEANFRRALESATRDDRLILETQIARTYGLRREFDRARAILKEIEPDVANAGTEVRVRYELELGRTFSSATHAPESQTPENRERAHSCFVAALTMAREAGLDALAIDAVHMLAFVDTAPADQLKWAEEALAIATTSTQPAARRWEAAIRNNRGYALHQLGRYEDALAEFRLAVELRERGNDVAATRIAYWMVAWTLRALDRNDEALEIQLRLERENDADGSPDPYVFEELELLYRARNDPTRAEHYAQRRRNLGQ